MDTQWMLEMQRQADHLVGIMKANDDSGFGSRANLEKHIRRIFDLAACGDPTGADSMWTSLNQAKYDHLAGTDSHFTDIKDMLDGWTGEAANNFRDYLSALAAGVDRIDWLIDGLIAILRSYSALILSFRQDLLNLVKQALDGITEAETARRKIGLAIAGAIAGIAGTIASAGGLVPVYTSLIAGASSISIEATGATNEMEVISEFVANGYKLIGHVDGERAMIEDAFRKLVELITGSHDGVLMVRPERPLLITAPDFQPSSFGLSDPMQGTHRRPTDTRDLVPEPPKKPNQPHDSTYGGGDEPRDRYPEQGQA